MSQIKPNITHYDKSFREGNAHGYQLYVELSDRDLKHIILDLATKTFISLEVYHFEQAKSDGELTRWIEEILMNNSVFKLPFKQVKFSVVNNRSTLIPNAVYDATKLSAYHKFNFAVRSDECYQADKLINLGAVNVYSLPDKLKGVLGKISNSSFLHFSSVFIEAAMLESKHRHALSSVHVNVMETTFQICVIKNQKLNLYNSFTFSTKEDFLYYLLFVLDQQNINNEEVMINLTGAIDKNTDLYKMLSKYVNTLSFGNRHSNLNYSYILEDTPKHHHYTLFSQFLCE